MHSILSFLYKADAEYGAGVARGWRGGGAGVAKVAKGDLARVKALAADLQD
ncbi:hypothetical protein [Pseudomonas sp. NPDC089401]|uniref:hypothetical protein n=1 Tax=Pseudomonas sp. NPDC089401 TaxID=3364462 RepID=UPI003830E746